MNPIALYRNSSFTVTTFGQQQYPLEAALLVAKTQGVALKHMVTPPSGANGPGFQSIVRQTADFSILADGVIIPLQAAVGITARDCPLVFLEYRDPEHIATRGVVFHAGRPALSPPTDCAGCSFSVVAAALNAIAPGGSDRTHVHAYITASICGPCFTHPDEAGQALLEPFRRIHRNVIVDEATGALNLRQVIENDLVGRGVPQRNITHDGLCTMTDHRLSSKRRGDTTYNLVVVCRYS